MTKLYVKGVDDCRDCPMMKIITTIGDTLGNCFCSMWKDKDSNNRLYAERNKNGDKTINIPAWCKLETL